MSKFSALTKSLIFHGVVVALVTVSFAFKDEIVVKDEMPIQVSFVPDEDVKPTEKKPIPVKEEPPAPEPEDKPQPAPKALEQPKPKQAKLDEKPKEKPQELSPQREIIKANEPKPEPKAKPKPPEKKPAEKKPEKPKEEPKAEEDTTTGFTSVLKNLADTMPVDTKKDGPKLTDSPTVDRMTTGELDAFRRQLSQCWNILPGAAKAETLAVNLTITVNPDRTVRDVQITDRSRYASDAFFRAAADNAIRAIRHPDCTPLDLPPDKYTMWKEITLNFDPEKMF